MNIYTLTICLIVIVIAFILLCAYIAKLMIIERDSCNNEVLIVNESSFYLKANPKITCTISSVKNSKPPRLILNVNYPEGSTFELLTTQNMFEELWSKSNVTFNQPKRTFP